MQFYLSNAPQGTVWWDDISLDRSPIRDARKVTVASINLRPAQDGVRAEENVRPVPRDNRAKVPAKTDVILLPEGITVVGNGKPTPRSRRQSPAPRRSGWARSRASGRRNRGGNLRARGRGDLQHRGADRSRGQVAGKYRKVYLPREEVEAGLTPGSDYPVFRTDFGTVGLMICYDVFFADPARALALRARR